MLYAAGIPLLYIVVLVRNRKALNPQTGSLEEDLRVISEDESVAHLGFLTEAYLPRFYYWEVNKAKPSEIPHAHMRSTCVLTL